MLRTSIILDMDGTRPIDLRTTGLAKNLSIAKWIFAFMGWPDQAGKAYPCLQYEIGRVNWPEGDNYFPCCNTEIHILGNVLRLN